MILVFVLYALFASVFVIAKIGLEYTQPLFLVGSRMLLAGILMLVYQYFMHPSKFQFDKKHFWRILKLGIFNIYLTNAFEFWGLKHLTSFKTCFIYSLSPFLSALFSYLIFSEKMTKKKWIGFFIGFVGFAPILVAEGAGEEQLHHLLFLSWGEISVLLACICSVYGWILLRQLVKEDGYSPIMANGLSMCIGGTFGLVHSFLSESWHPIPVTEFVPFIECAILLIIVSNFLCYNLYGYLLKKFTATFISFAGWTTPVFAALFGWLVLGELVTWPFILSAAIVLLGLAIFYQEELRQGYYIVPKKAALQNVNQTT